MFDEKLDKAQELHSRVKLIEAANLCKEVLTVDPRNYRARMIYAACVLDNGQYEKAADLFSQVLRESPTDPICLVSLSSIFRETGDMDNAEKFALAALDTQKAGSMGLINYGHHSLVSGNWDEGIQAFRIACGVDPTNVLGHSGLGCLLQLTGETQAGLLEMERSEDLHEIEQGREQQIPFFKWNGMHMPGEKLLVLLNQGYGDCIQHARYLEDAARYCTGGLIVAGRPDVLPLFGAMECVDSVVDGDGGMPDPYGAYVRITSLPYLGMKSCKQPYMKTSIPSHNGVFNVGICWRGSPIPRGRSFPIGQFMSETSTLAVNFICLQKDLAGKEGAYFSEMQSPDLSNWTRTSKVIASCQLVVSNDTSIIHLAGAMGVPGIVLLSKNYDPRWGVNSAGPSPIYDSINIARQDKPGDWTQPIKMARRYIESFI